MVTIVPPTLLNLAGIPAATFEPHIQPGNHLRVGHNPVLGLPVAPFILQRARLSERLPDNFAPRRDIVFRNARDEILTLPITVEKGDEIRATIVQGAGLSCIFVGMMSRAADKPQPGPVRVPVPTRPVVGPRITRPVNRDGGTLARLDTRSLRDMLVDRLAQLREAPTETGDLRMRVYGPSVGLGPTLVGERRAAPYTIGAPAITEVLVTGRGIITDMAWIAAQDVVDLSWDTIDVLNLPRTSGLRYLSLIDPVGRAENRMRRQAPNRRPLQETQGATQPGAAPGFSDTEESERVHALANPLDRDLDALIDGPDLPFLASETVQVTDAAGRPLATAPGEQSEVTIGHLARVMQGSLDPGVAGWLGFKGLDQKMDLIDGLTFYRVIGFFRHPQSIGVPPDRLLSLPINVIAQSDRQMSAPVVFRTFVKLAGNYLRDEGEELRGELAPASDYMMMGAICAVDGRAIPEPPAPPQILTPEHVSWLPALPPQAVREIECPLKGVLVGATLAAEREQPAAGFETINRRVEGTVWHIPLALGLTGQNDNQPLAEQDGRQGFVADRTAGAEAARYHIAQQDRFGRWSGFAIQNAAPGPRPKPPRPVVQGSYRQPGPADAATVGGTFHLRVPLPENESLAPGSFSLSHVRLHFRHHGVDSPGVEVAMADIDAAVGTAIAIEVPPPGEVARRAVPVTLTGPILAPTEQRRMVITAEWIDSAGQASATSEPLRLRMTDPRPPAQMPIPDVLLYSSRPDATGLAWVERSWTAPVTNAPIYAAYYTDENRLLAWLSDQGRAVEAGQIAAITDRAARAGRFRAIQADFPDHLFERLPTAIDAPNPTTRRLSHALSGSSRVLNAYKIATEAPGSGARPVLRDLDMVFYGVPNSDPPPRPSVSVRLVPPQAGEPDLVVEVTVTAEIGTTRGERARIYRTRGTAPDPLNAPLVASLPLPAPDPITGRQILIFRDAGAADIAPAARLSAFARYQWRAEVQGAPESGSTVPGMWSRPSDPAGLATIPLPGPVAPSFDGFGGTAVAGGTQDLTLAFSHPGDLRPTPFGNWRIEILRAPPGEAFGLMADAPILELPLVIGDPAADGFTPLATQFKATLYDPLGRAAPPVTMVST
ncbi:hypothetical protein MLD63_00385 (plasmid) [Paracoccus sp. TK19116]|uniref:Uncharacterized protein n=1 Tax=Paracoccus albicereus TaxID=2922394 RepID=A0ABT1MKR4_9RHOB|nr:hypothetical protein [Paracoccus albicereus]MCQ0968893.1 hypothetical protein [Paracoccus albicereus]